MKMASTKGSSPPTTLSSKTTVSVVIPAFNSATYLGEALDSVLAQTYQPIEVIVVDDGSEDETAQVAAAYSGKITYIRKERGGPAAARNVGIREAKGEWIAFQDADDIWMPELLEKLVKAAAETGADLVFCDSLTLKDNGVVGASRLERSGFKKRLDALASHSILRDPFEQLLDGGCCIHTPGVLVRRDALLQVGLFDEAFYGYEEVDLWLRLALSFRFAVLKDALHLRRIHAGNMSHDGLVLLTGEIKTYEKLERYAPTLTRGTRLRRVLRKRKAELLREQGAIYLGRGDVHSARKSWAKSFRFSCSPRLAAYWLATYLPQSVAKGLRDRKRQIWPVPPSAGYTG